MFSGTPNHENEKMFLNRLGRFFLYMGVLSGMLFILSDHAMATNFTFLIVAGIFFLTGVFLIKSNPPPPVLPSGRFSLLRRKKINQDEEFYNNDGSINNR